MPFLDSLDIANRALQHCGSTQIASPTEDSKNNRETAFAYDKVRRAELRRNVWRFSIRTSVLRAIGATTLLLNAPAYSATATYLPGAIVKDTNGQYWVSLKPDNRNNLPGGNNEYWDSYFGPLTVSLWDSTTTYFAGELVYAAGAAAGSYQVYMSLQNANADNPATAVAWDSATVYYADQTVSYSGSQWRSLLPFNIGVTPADNPPPWDPTATYSAGQYVAGSDNFLYASSISGNIGHDPTTDNAVHWTVPGVAVGWSRVPSLVASATSWRPISALGLQPLGIVYPLGAGPSGDVTTRNAYRLPAGFLREAPQHPKAGSTSYLGAPSGLAYTDWEYGGDYIVSSEIGPIILRFVADVTKVSSMDDMFCEGLACRVALAVCEPITQSGVKLQAIASEYKTFMGEARIVNSIETGAVEPPEDNFIACRA